MLMKKEVKNIPELRFSEFDGEWEINKIGAYISERKNTATPDLPLYSLTIENGIVPKSKRYERSFLVNNEAEAYKEMQYNDFAFNPMNLRFGALARLKNDGKVAVSKYYNIFYCNSKAEPSFFESYLTRYSMIQFYDRMSSGTLDEKKRVHFLDFIHFKKPFPTLPEQQKIASFLTAVDKKIEQLTRKKELLEQYKKGVMQKIFSQEIRFKDDNGQDYPDWEEKRLGDISRNICYGMNSAAIEYDGENKYIRITDINENDRTFSPQPVTSPNGLLEDKYLVRKGDILFARTGASVGKSYLYNVGDGKLYFAGFLIRFSIKKANPFFVYVQTLLPQYDKWVQVMSMRSGQPGINAEEYKTLTISLPSLSEQNKIANFLLSIDKKITAAQTQLTQTQNFKKGLLQKMFV